MPKLKDLEFKEYYQAVMHCILNDIKNYEVKVKANKMFHIVKLKK
jgi:hypothetical protein